MEPLGFWVTQASTALLVILGAFTMWVRPRTRTHQAFGRATIALGATLLLANWLRRLRTEEPGLELMGVMVAMGIGASIVIHGIWTVLHRFPKELQSGQKKLLAFPVVFGIGGLAAGAGTGLRLAQSWTPTADWVPAAVAVAVALQQAAAGVLMGAACLFGLRFRSTPASAGDDRTQYVMMAAGLGAWPAALGGAYFMATFQEDRYVGLFATIGTGVAIGIWLLATRGAGSRAARNLVLLLVGCALVALWVAIGIGSRDIDDTGFFGAVRLLSFGIFAYAILRHHLLGLEVKVRWTVSHGTLAALFVALVIIGSQLVQNVTQNEFGVWGGAILGGLALFLLSPLQRMADALARRVVPRSTEVAAQKARESTLADAYRMALRGGITEREEMTLASLARDLGVDARRALEIRRVASRWKRNP